MAWSTGDWAWSLEHDEPCRLVEVHRLWGQGTVLAWLPGPDATVRLSEENLATFSDRAATSPERIAYVTAAADDNLGKRRPRHYIPITLGNAKRSPWRHLSHINPYMRKRMGELPRLFGPGVSRMKQYDSGF